MKFSDRGPAVFSKCLFICTCMSHLSTVDGSGSVPAECHRSESGCTGLSAPWRCGPSGLERSLHTEQKQNRYIQTQTRHPCTFSQIEQTVFAFILPGISKNSPETNSGKQNARWCVWNEVYRNEFDTDQWCYSLRGLSVALQPKTMQETALGWTC